VPPTTYAYPDSREQVTATPATRGRLSGLLTKAGDMISRGLAKYGSRRH
jgi:hypothetical protein